MKKKYVMKDTTNYADWKKEFEKWEKYNLPFPPKVQVIPTKQTPYEKEMAKLMEQLIDYEYAQAHASKILRTPWGVLMWTPKAK